MESKLKIDRRTILTGVAALGTVTFLPYAARAASNRWDSFPTVSGEIEVYPVSHASFVMKTPSGVVYNDPVGEPSQYAEFPTPNVILVTHEHGDHFNLDTLNAVIGPKSMLVVNPAVFAKLPSGLQSQAIMLANGDTYETDGFDIEAIPAYNQTQERKKFHPKGRDNGYVLNVDGFRIYISGDTEGVPEMRALTDIDLAFVCMNLPFTMDVEAAASAVSEFKPTYCYPYHYRGRDNGTQDPNEFADALTEAVEVKLGGWYGG
jgi:L-ascorbate metabolism protein UlaG (beta-lactamase superfamily)